MNDIPLYQTLTDSIVGVAVVVVVVIFIRYIRDRDTIGKEQQQEFLKIVTNHMEHENKSFEKMAGKFENIENNMKGVLDTNARALQKIYEVIDKRK